MNEPSTVVSNLLAERYGDLGRRAADELRRWLSGAVPFAYPEVIARQLAPENVPLLFDAFWQVLPFGTGGRRGRVGYGANRMNPSTVAMTIQGHCNFLRQRFPGRNDLTVVVANDVRVYRDVAGTYGFLGRITPCWGCPRARWPSWRARSTPATASPPSCPIPPTRARSCPRPSCRS